MLNRAIRELYITNLGVKKDEKVIVFTDSLVPQEDVSDSDRRRREGLLSLALKVAETGREINQNITFITYPSLMSHSMEPPREIWLAAFGDRTIRELEDRGFFKKMIHKEALSEQDTQMINSVVESNKHDAIDVVIALSNFSTSHTRFRDLLTNICKSRYASMPLFDESMFYGPMQVDWKALKQRTNNLAASLDNAEKVLITAPNGTDLTIGIKGRKVLADTGDLTLPGAFGNLPAGEVFVAPVEGTTEGTLVLEWAPTAKLESAVVLEIEKGLVKGVSGNEPYVQRLVKKLGENPDFRNIAELGIGTNDMAKRADNILESEKILGTIHIAFGDNSTFGGNVRTPFHQDFVIFKPTVTIVREDEEKTILDEGVLSI